MPQKKYINLFLLPDRVGCYMLSHQDWRRCPLPTTRRLLLKFVGSHTFSQVLHVANHVLSTLTQQGDRGLPAALQTNDPSRFEGGEEALLRCVQELVSCIRISERDTLARLICRYARGLL